MYVSRGKKQIQAVQHKNRILMSLCLSIFLFFFFFFFFVCFFHQHEELFFYILLLFLFLFLFLYSVNSLAKRTLLVEKSENQLQCRCFLNRIFDESAFLLPSLPTAYCLLLNCDRRLHLFTYKMVSIAKVQ